MHAIKRVWFVDLLRARRDFVHQAAWQVFQASPGKLIEVNATIVDPPTFLCRWAMRYPVL